MEIRTNETRVGSTEKKKQELFKKLADAIQEDNIDKQPLISLVKCLKNIMKKKKKEIPRNTEQTWGKCYVNNQWQNM